MLPLKKNMLISARAVLKLFLTCLTGFEKSKFVKLSNLAKIGHIGQYCQVSKFVKIKDWYSFLPGTGLYFSF